MRLPLALLLTIAAFVSASATHSARAGDGLFEPDDALVRMDTSLDWHAFSLLGVQDQQRYKTAESFARETMAAMTGKSNLPGLSPCASLLEWMFNADRYEDVRVIYLKDAVMRREFSADLSLQRREQIFADGLLTPRELRTARVERRLRELQAIQRMQSATNRVLEALQIAFDYPSMFKVFPAPHGDATSGDPWSSPREATWNLPPELLGAADLTVEDFKAKAGTRGPLAGVSAADVLPWARLAQAWKARDVAQVRANLDEIVVRMPAIAAAGYYPPESHRKAELLYYRLHKFTTGWMVYLLATVVAAFALATRWRAPTVIAAILVVLGLLWHGGGIALRWYILERIPVANLFEAMFFASWIVVFSILIISAKYYQHPMFLLAAAATGFFALVMADIVMPAHQSNLDSIRAILDDVMLRIHTVLIVSSYALVFLGSVIALVYLFGYYRVKAPMASVEAGAAAAIAGAALFFLSAELFHLPPVTSVTAARYVLPENVPLLSACVAALLLATIPLLRLIRTPSMAISLVVMFAAGGIVLAVGSHDFAIGTAKAMIYGGAAWTAGTAAALGLARLTAREPRGSLVSAVAGGGGVALPPARVTAYDRPLMAGGTPGDESSSAQLPRWLSELDWCHLIVLNIIFVTLFTGTILGAVWADYSWGRPWGWDPKEVFAMNTWIVYAILIHVRFIVKNRGLWTAWLSLIGCAVMAFNWYVVNMHIVGLHSYA